MNDVPRAEACASEVTAAQAPTAPPASSPGEVSTNQLARLLPRLAEIGSRVAVAAPSLIVIFGTDSLGRGGRGC